MSEDKRPDPKPRKNPKLWQAYLWWREMNEMRKRHTLRISSIKKEKSNLDAEYEELVLGMFPYAGYTDDDGDKVSSVEDFALREMKMYGKAVGPIWDWLIGIRGIGEPTAAKLLAQFDDSGKFDTVSKFWRFSGWGTYPYWVNEKGKLMAPKQGWKWVKKNGANEKVWTVPDPLPGWVLKQSIDRNIEGWHSPYNRILKSEVWIAVDNFIKQHTPVYSDFYYAEKEHLRARHPEKIKKNGRTMFNDGHIHNRAIRKTAKLFLQHFWVTWREFDELPVSEPWILREGSGHNRYIGPPKSDS